jgi:glycerol-3-phosphate acyltransferase PlsX
VALRRKKDSSMRVAISQVKAFEAGPGRAHVCVSAGNTGALMAVARYLLKTIEGIDRPAIATVMPNMRGGFTTVLDLGANVDCTAEHLLQFAFMGSALVAAVEGKANPTVGLLNIGEEASKGTDLLKAAHPLLAAAKVQFVGNVEGNEVFRNKCDVLVTDGFTGNVLLKFCEDFAAQMLHLVVGECAKAGVAIPREVLGRVQKRIDYSEYGGALLLGVGGIVFKGHGRSDHHAVSNALHAAQRALDARINEHIVTALAEVQTSATN